MLESADRADSIVNQVAKDRSTEILSEIRELKDELLSRLDALEAQVGGGGLSGAETSLLDATGPGASLPGVPVVSGDVSAAAHADPDGSLDLPAGGDVQVIVSPLRDFSLARVVEEALADTDGVEKASLRELRGDSATIDAKVGAGVSLVSSLRRKLPVAFDVTESSDDSVTIALAEPMGGRESGVTAPVGS